MPIIAFGTASPAASLYGLPTELFIEIVRCCNEKAMYSLAMVCKHFKNIIYTSNELSNSWDDGNNAFCSVYDCDWWRGSKIRNYFCACYCSPPLTRNMIIPNVSFIAARRIEYLDIHLKLDQLTVLMDGLSKNFVIKVLKVRFNHVDDESLYETFGSLIPSTVTRDNFKNLHTFVMETLTQYNNYKDDKYHDPMSRIRGFKSLMKIIGPNVEYFELKGGIPLNIFQWLRNYCVKLKHLEFNDVFDLIEAGCDVREKSSMVDEDVYFDQQHRRHLRIANGKGETPPAALRHLSLSRHISPSIKTLRCMLFTLHTLELWNIPSLSWRELGNISRIDKSLVNLEVLKGSLRREFLTPFLEICPKLKVLNNDCNTVFDVDVVDQLIKCCPLLTAVRLDQARMHKGCHKKLTGLLHLETYDLHIDCRYVWDVKDGLEYFCKHSPALIEFNFSCNCSYDLENTCIDECDAHGIAVNEAIVRCQTAAPDMKIIFDPYNFHENRKTVSVS